MCGIAGVMRLRPGRALPPAEVLDRMTDTLAHRGPDARGVWMDGVRGVGLGHRRLSIRDLSPTGAQPMTSGCGRCIIVYNGEVYSHAEIAADLARTGRTLKGHSDTEIILEACAEWGVDAVLPRLIGMFAFALYDKASGELVLARDRLGIKPLYWSDEAGLLRFGSELKALRALPDWTPRIDRRALASYMRHNYIPAPHTIYEGVRKLEPGTVLKAGRDGIIRISRYWDLTAIAAEAVRAPRDIADEEAVDRLDALLSDAVRRRLVSDVPIGALLSGGVDSSLVTALMAETAGRRINTYTIGFAEKGFDEAPAARAIAGHLGTEHTELYATAAHALDLVTSLPRWYDEPFADASQLPTLLVCELTRKHVTVALSGDGGDELFAGYTRYPQALGLWSRASSAPAPVRGTLARAVLATPDALIDRAGGLLPRRLRKTALGSRLRSFARAVVTNDPDALYRRMISHWDEPGALVIGGEEYKGVLWDTSLSERVPDQLERMMLADTLTYLPDDILTKVDRASMAVGLEARVPLLDHRVVELAWTFPRRLKLRGTETKWALRQVLYRRLPRTLIDRPKMGFGIPLATWLRGPLRDWAEDLLDETRLRDQGLFHPAAIRQHWRAHLDGTDWAHPLWNVLMAQAWLADNAAVKR
ncbi:MAG: asparagine synthase (glutamine-hydrolyzing) [Hyphomicrobiaceae bacterium]